MNIPRREALARLSLAGSALLVPGLASPAAPGTRRTTMGIVTYAFGIHQKQQWAGRQTGLSPALALLEESHQLGAGGIMADLSSKDTETISQFRKRAEDYGMFIEASVMLPKSAEDTARFEKDVQLALVAGATLARTVIMPGRRYEQFKSLQEFRDFRQRGQQALERAAPILSRHKFRLAVENHKDERISEKLETLKQVGSEFIGICVDVGNSFTLLEDPLDTVRAFAPFALTVHIKDQAVREYPQGFLFADAALGQGFLDLPQIIQILRKANPSIHFNLETITRDALEVPLLTPGFWSTLPDVPAAELARTLSFIKGHASPRPFPAVSQLPPAEQLALESRNIEQSITYARERLGFV